MSLLCSRQLKIRENKIRRIELQSLESSPKNWSVKVLFAISPYKSNEIRAVLFIEKEQILTATNKEDRVDQIEP